MDVLQVDVPLPSTPAGVDCACAKVLTKVRGAEAEADDGKLFESIVDRENVCCIGLGTRALLDAANCRDEAAEMAETAVLPGSLARLRKRISQMRNSIAKHYRV